MDQQEGIIWEYWIKACRGSAVDLDIFIVQLFENPIEYHLFLKLVRQCLEDRLRWKALLSAFQSGFFTPGALGNLIDVLYGSGSDVDFLVLYFRENKEAIERLYHEAAPRFVYSEHFLVTFSIDLFRRILDTAAPADWQLAWIPRLLRLHPTNIELLRMLTRAVWKRVPGVTSFLEDPARANTFYRSILVAKGYHPYIIAQLVLFLHATYCCNLDFLQALNSENRRDLFMQCQNTSLTVWRQTVCWDRHAPRGLKQTMRFLNHFLLYLIVDERLQLRSLFGPLWNCRMMRFDLADLYRYFRVEQANARRVLEQVLNADCAQLVLTFCFSPSWNLENL